MQKLAHSLGVKPDISFRPVQSNRASVPLNQDLSTFLHHPSGFFHRLLKPFTHRLPFPLRNRLRKGVKQANLRPVRYPPMNPETERNLRMRYQDEIERLECILGRDLSGWKAV
jgi:hypothetical protein